MKKTLRLLALSLALLVALSPFALGESAEEPVQDESLLTPAENPVLFTFDGEEVTQSEVEDMLYYLLYNSYTYDSGDYETAMDYIVQNRCIEAKIREWGLDQFTDEENEAFLAEAQAEWDAAIEDYAAYFVTDESEEAWAKARSDGEAYYQAHGYSVESVAESMKMSDSLQKLENRILEGKDVSVSEDEIRQSFEEYAQYDKDLYEGNIALYELYQSSGQESWYVPEGYRGVIHILLDVDDELLTAYQNAQAVYEESVSEEDGDAPNSSDLKQAAEAALNAVLDSRRDALNDIYARLEKGESFESLIAEYGADPDMEDETLLAEGKPLHPESLTGGDDALLSAAFSDKVQSVGDVSDPFVGMDGIYIVKYQRDVPSGFVEITEEIHAWLESMLSNQKINAVYADALEAWEKEHEIVYFQDAIEQARSSAYAAEEDGE